MMRQTSQTQAGFTLIETLVALLILSLISAAGGLLLINASNSGKQVREHEAALRDLDLAEAFLRDDIAALTARVSAAEDGYGDAYSLVGGETPRAEGVLQFVRNGWQNPGGYELRGNFQRVTYSLENGAFVREAHLRPDPSNATPSVRRTLLTGVSAVNVRFLRGVDWSDYWVGTDTPPGNILPELIELTLTLDDGGKLRIAALTGGRS